MDRRVFLVMIGAGLVGPWLRGAPAPRTRWTPEEQEILDVVARDRGRAWAERHAHLILDQARAIGEL